jgi:hypothetical protein
LLAWPAGYGSNYTVGIDAYRSAYLAGVEIFLSPIKSEISKWKNDRRLVKPGAKSSLCCKKQYWVYTSLFISIL